MPYKKNSDINAPARKSMTSHGQTIFRKAFNSALKSKGDESSAFAIANAAVNKAGERKKTESFASLVEISVDADEPMSWVIALWKYTYSDYTFWQVNEDIMRELLTVKDPIQIHRIIKKGKKLSYGTDVHFADFELSGNVAEWADEDRIDLQAWIKQELAQWGGR